jgi:uncharacterized protein with PQ loop repeat
MTATLGSLAAVLSISNVWPQVWRSCRHGRTGGLSPTTSWLAVSLNLCWLTFGLLIGDPAQVVTHAVVGAGNTAVLAALLVAQPRLRSPRALLGTAAGAACLVALAAGSTVAVVLVDVDPAAAAAVLGSVTTLTGMAAALPQLLGILVDRTRDLSGMSPARWHLGAASGASWVTYGWLLGQPTMWLSAGFGTICAVTTCLVLWRRRPAGTAGALATARRAGRRPHPAGPRSALAAAA